MFITFEGIEGSGKSSHAEKLAKRLESIGYHVVITSEPGGTKIGKRIREILLAPESKGMDVKCELLLYLADRVQHQKDAIVPALNAGEIVICDRYFDASVAYQAKARGLGKFAEELIYQFAEPVPNLTILFDCLVETGIKRAKKRIAQKNEQAQARFEAEGADFHRRVRAAYLALAKSHPDRIKVVNTEQHEAKVGEAVWEIVSKYIRDRRCRRLQP